MNMKQRVVVISAGLLHLIAALWTLGLWIEDKTDLSMVFHGYMLKWLFITTFAVVLYLLFKDRSPQR